MGGQETSAGPLQERQTKEGMSPEVRSHGYPRSRNHGGHSTLEWEHRGMELAPRAVDGGREMPYAYSSYLMHSTL